MEDEVVMICWENLDKSQDKNPDKEVSGEDESLDDGEEKQNNGEAHEKYAECTVDTGNQLKISIEDFNSGTDDDASTCASQETSLKRMVYITNIKKTI